MDDESNILLRASGSTPEHYSWLALASFICAVLAVAGLLLAQIADALVILVLMFVPAVITGHLARSQFRRAPRQFRNESMATFGLSVGYLVLFLNAFTLAAMIWLGTR